MLGSMNRCSRLLAIAFLIPFILEPLSALEKPWLDTSKPVAERVTLLRRAFDATMQDPEFKADVEKMRVSHGPMTGEDLQKLVSQVSDLPADVTEMVRKVYQQ